MREILEAALALLDSGGTGALATVTKATGSTPQVPGARLLLLPDDRLVGTVGGGAVEQSVVEALFEARRSGEARLLVRHLGYDLGMCCGGTMEIFVEPVASPERLIVFGAGHVARPTAALARTIGFDVTVVDEREELCTAERFPGCRLVLGDAAAFLRERALGDRDYALVMTHDHRLDEEILALLLSHRPAYVGLVGSERKVTKLSGRIRELRGGDVSFARVFAPVGLDLGAVTPEEIAVSVAAELVLLRRGGQGAAGHLRSARALGEAEDTEP